MNYYLEKHFKVLQYRNTLHLASGYDRMEGCRYSHHLAAAKEQGVLTPTRQGAYESFGNGVVDRITTIFDVSKELGPEGIQVIQSLLHQITSWWMYIGQHCIQLASYFYNYLFGLKILTASLNLSGT